MSSSSHSWSDSSALICDHSPLIVQSYTEIYSSELHWAPAVNGPGNCNHQLQQKWEETHRSMFKMSWFLLKSSLAPHTHFYLHSNEYKLSIIECIELFMCQMFHPSWCQVPGCHTTGHTGCGECDANVLLIRYLIISNNIYNDNIQNSPQPRRDADGGAVMMEEYFLRKQFHISRIPPVWLSAAVTTSRRSDNQSQSPTPVSSNVVI